MEPRDLKVGEIIQLDPTTTANRMFAGCLMIVSEPKSFGCQGYVQSLGEGGNPGGQAYYRAIWTEMWPTGGTAPWLIP